MPRSLHSLFDLYRAFSNCCTSFLSPHIPTSTNYLSFDLGTYPWCRFNAPLLFAHRRLGRHTQAGAFGHCVSTLGDLRFCFYIGRHAIAFSIFLSYSPFPRFLCPVHLVFFKTVDEAACISTYVRGIQNVPSGEGLWAGLLSASSVRCFDSSTSLDVVKHTTWLFELYLGCMLLKQ